MKKIVIKDNIIPKIDRNISCIGYFDGVHKGHQALINFTIYMAKNNNCKSMIICFDPDPEDIINPLSCKKHILSKEDRLNSFAEMGIDIVCIIKFNKKLMKAKPLDFIKDFLMKLNIESIVCGYDFSFGFLGKGDAKLLNKYINTTVIDEISYYGKKISSTRIRDLISKGNFRLANKLLNYNYSVILKVINCSRKGSKWLIRAIPVDNSLLMPINGAYNGYLIDNNTYIFESSSRANINEEILLEFKYE